MKYAMVYLLLYEIHIKVQNKHFTGKTVILIHILLKYGLLTQF